MEQQRELDECTIVGGDSNTSLSIINRSNRQKISKNIIEQNRVTNALHLTDIERIFV